jgi:hypothetical protein
MPFRPSIGVVSTAWCPNCRSEYRPGFTVCADCGSALVDSLAAPAEHSEHDNAPAEPGPFTDGDDVVALVELSIVEADLVAAQLGTGGIPAAVFGTGAEIYTGLRSGRVMVRRSDLEAAALLVAELLDPSRAPTQISDEDLAALAEESAGQSDPATGAQV